MKLIELTKGYFAKIDDEDFVEVSKYKWHVLFKRKGGKPYANTSIHISGSGKNRKKKNINLHKLIMKTTNHVDHKNGDTLDNQKINLRECNNSQNHMNIPKIKKKTASKYKGVSFRKEHKYSKWRATIRVNGKSMELGCFVTEIEAAKAYNEAATKYHGEFANINNLEV
jgi:hypothetical protein